MTTFWLTVLSSAMSMRTPCSWPGARRAGMRPGRGAVWLVGSGCGAVSSVWKNSRNCERLTGLCRLRADVVASAAR